MPAAVATSLVTAARRTRVGGEPNKSKWSIPVNLYCVFTWAASFVIGRAPAAFVSLAPIPSLSTPLSATDKSSALAVEASGFAF